MTALWRLFAAVEALVRWLIGQAAVRTGAQREALLREALEALETLAEAALAAPELVEDEFTAAALEAMPEGAALPEPEPVEQIGQALEDQLLRAAETASERSREAFETVTKETAQVAADDATTALETRDGRRLPLGSYAKAVTAHAGRKAATEGVLAALPEGSKVRWSKHGTTHPKCRPNEGKVYPADKVPRPPLHPGCKHFLTPV